MYDWWTEHRCPAVYTNPNRDVGIQCTREEHTKGSHLSLYTNTAWSAR